MVDDAHRPVLLEEALDALAVQPSGLYVDATFGRGGHARAVLARLAPEGRLVVCDRDPEALAAAHALAGADPRVDVLPGPFSGLGAALGAAGLEGRVNGLLADLGVSSPQLDRAERGFSFMRDGPLDMRMDPTTGERAADFLARASEATLADVFHRLGDERHARRIARAICEARARTPILGTRQLADLVKSAHPRWPQGHHPATRVFQAIRLHINRELEELAALLACVPALLARGGRLVVISFHSLEDRLVKQFIRSRARRFVEDPSVLTGTRDVAPDLEPLGRPITPSDAEAQANPRARSATLRAAVRP